MQNAGELVDAFRQDVLDMKKPYLWTDAECYRYADAAYKQFVRKMGGIADFTSAATQVTLSAGEPIVDLHPSILSVRTASLASTGSDVTIVNVQDMADSIGSNDYGNIQRLAATKIPGNIRYLIIGMERNKGQVVMAPTVDDTINLVIYRLPLITLASDDDSLAEVAEHHHESLLLYMKHLAFKKNDAETFDRARSDENGLEFEAKCAEAKSEWERYKHKTRVVQYGGL
jgi:hypothetical protein